MNPKDSAARLREIANEAAAMESHPRMTDYWRPAFASIRHKAEAALASPAPPATDARAESRTSAYTRALRGPLAQPPATAGGEWVPGPNDHRVGHDGEGRQVYLSEARPAAQGDAEAEIRKADLDATYCGQGFLVDGVRVAPNRVQIITRNAPPADRAPGEVGEDAPRFVVDSLERCLGELAYIAVVNTPEKQAAYCEIVKFIRRLAARAPSAQGEWRYFQAPFRVVERNDAYFVEDSHPTCPMRVMMMWPAHPPETTEEAERETWQLAEVFAAAGNQFVATSNQTREPDLWQFRARDPNDVMSRHWHDYGGDPGKRAALSGRYEFRALYTSAPAAGDGEVEALTAMFDTLSQACAVVPKGSLSSEYVRSVLDTAVAAAGKAHTALAHPTAGEQQGEAE